MTPLVRRSIAALASTAFMTFALAGALPLHAAQEAGTAKTKTQATKKKTAKKAEAAAPAEDEPEAKPKAKGGRQAPPDPEHRLPAYYPGLNLTEAQKASIFKVLGKYHPQIQELEKKADDLRERQKSELEDVLTAPQKKALTEARKAASDRRKAAAKAKDAD